MPVKQQQGLLNKSSTMLNKLLALLTVTLIGLQSTAFACLPEHLKTRKHNDWIWPFSMIPRTWSTVCWGVPKQIAGNQEKQVANRKEGILGPAPIGELGSWQVSRYPKAPLLLKYIPLYVAITLPNGRHFRFGARWDDIDGYVTLPVIATRKFPATEDMDRNTEAK